MKTLWQTLLQDGDAHDLRHSDQYHVMTWLIKRGAGVPRVFFVDYACAVFLLVYRYLLVFLYPVQSISVHSIQTVLFRDI